MPNPTLEKLYEGCKIVRENDIDFILSVGGGSCCDYSKALSASAWCEEDPWEKYYIRGEKVDNKIVPMGCILTMPGTGSEMNGGAVITNEKTKLKIGYQFDENVFPKFSILNPVLTYTLPRYQMISGIYDAFCHLSEQYFSGEDDNTSDYVIEGLMKSLINNSKVAVENPKDYEARSNIMWSSTLALNTLVAKGKAGDWMVHMIGQQISAYTDAAHGMTLSAISMAYYHKIYSYGLSKFKRFAINVWGVNPEQKTDEQVALEGLDKMKDWMNSIELVMNIKELGVTEDMVESIAKSVHIFNNGYKQLTSDEIIDILKESM